MSKKAFIFDLDGTILDTLQSISYTVNLCLKQLNLEPLPLENFKYYAGDGAKTLIERACADVGVTDSEKIEEAYILYKKFFETTCMYEVKPFPKMKETLTKLKEQGFLLAVFTNKDHENAIPILNEMFGENFFHETLGYCNIFDKKPCPDGAVYLAKKMGVNPEQCIYVGDTDTDMKTGNNAGMYTVGVTWGFRQREELERSGAEQIITNVEDLLLLI